MIKVVLDTNLLVSAILSPHGKPADILKLVFNDVITLIISPAILREAHRVLRYPKLLKLMKKNGISFGEVDDFLKKMSRVAFITPGNQNIEVIHDDPSDNMILACALEGNADFIVSGDRHLRDLKVYQNIRIVDPVTLLIIINYEA